MKPATWFLGVVACAGLVGCVDRRYVITSNPPGAVVFRNGQQLGAAPVDDHFVYYGNYEFLLVKDGYETKKVVQRIRAPWFEYPPFDFIAENLWPFRIMDVHRYEYTMEPLPAVRTDVLLGEAQNLRNRGRSITPPPEANPPEPPLPIIGAPEPPPGQPVPPPPPPMQPQRVQGGSQ